MRRTAEGKVGLEAKANATEKNSKAIYYIPIVTMLPKKQNWPTLSKRKRRISHYLTESMFSSDIEVK